MESSWEIGKKVLGKDYREKIVELLQRAAQLKVKEEFADDYVFFARYNYLIKLLCLETTIEVKNNFFNNRIIIIQVGFNFEAIGRTERFKYALKYKDNARHYQLPRPD